ncbi:MAG: hypothetical protein WB952_25150 [Terriglobales bacterium]
MTNRELIESWSVSSGAVRRESSRNGYVFAEEKGAWKWGWKVFGLVVSLGVSLAGWAGLILATRHFVR